ncbi:MAG: hypothetical protein WDO18_03710 [Acidobacteriota bacterium]
MAFVLAVFFGVLLFAVYVVAANWNDYKDILNPHGRKARARSLRKDS